MLLELVESKKRLNFYDSLIESRRLAISVISSLIFEFSRSSDMFFVFYHCDGAYVT